MPPPRVALFHEPDTCPNLVRYAERLNLPFLSIRIGTRPDPFRQCGQLRTLVLPRATPGFDPLFWRHTEAIEDALKSFKPNILHLTGPSELGMFAAYFAQKRKLPLAATWHDPIPEDAPTRLAWIASMLPETMGKPDPHATPLDLTLRFYTLADLLFAPTPELCEMLTSTTHKPCQSNSLDTPETTCNAYRPLLERTGAG